MAEDDSVPASEDNRAEWPHPRAGVRWLLRSAVVLAGLLLAFRFTQWARDGLSLDVALSLLLVLSLGLLLTLLLRPRTRADNEGLLLRGEFSREHRIPWSNVQDIRAEGGRWATAVQVDLSDGRTMKLPGVSPEQIDEVRAARRLDNH